MEVPISVQQLRARYIVEEVNTIPSGVQKLSAEDDYAALISYGLWFYVDRAPIWCTYDEWNQDEAARLLSGILPTNDKRGTIFDQTYWSDAEKIALGPNHATYFIFKLFNTNFKCVEHVSEILSRSTIGDRASPKAWAEYARAKKLLPHENYFTEVDNSPLLCLLEAGKNLSEVSQSQSQTSVLKTKPRYSTPLRDILDATVDQFYDPRRNPDAKREEVVDWVMAKLAMEGLPESRQIAESMFTILKPVDHDPRKKRGEPL